MVRIDLAGRDRRTFTPTPWGSPSWKRGYARRAVLERINSRLDGSFGFERHFMRGRAKMKTRLGLARISHQAACRRQKTLGFH